MKHIKAFADIVGDEDEVKRFIEDHDLEIFLISVMNKILREPTVVSLTLELFEMDDNSNRLYLLGDCTLEDASDIVDLEERIFQEVFVTDSSYDGKVVFSLD